MKKFLLLASILAISFSSHKLYAQTWKPDHATVQRFEVSIKPTDYPKWWYIGKPRKLSDYARYYAGQIEKDHHVLVGEFIQEESSSEKVPGVYIVSSQKRFPDISDGACSVVHIRYDVDTKRLLSMECNGRG